MPSVDLQTHTITRLQKHAIPLVDDFDSVIGKLIDAYEGTPKGGIAITQPTSTVQVFDPAAPPNLTHTTVKYIKFCGTVFKPNETYWNTLMYAAIHQVAARGLAPEELKKHILANCAIGVKDDNGYKHLADTGLSIQGQDANGAWKAIYHLAATFHLPVEVTFTWQNTSKAAAPNVTGSFSM